MIFDASRGLSASYLPPCGGGRCAKRGGRGVNFDMLRLPLTPSLTLPRS